MRFLLGLTPLSFEDQRETGRPERLVLDVGRPVSVSSFGSPYVFELRTRDGVTIGTPFALSNLSGVHRVPGSVLDLVFRDLDGGIHGAHFRADAPMELHLVCVDGCGYPYTLELVFE